MMASGLVEAGDQRSQRRSRYPVAEPPPAPRQPLRPHIRGLTVVTVLHVIGTVAGLAPLLAVAELGRTLLAPGPTDHARVWTIVIVGAAGLLVRLVLTAASSGIGHLIDGDVQLSLRRALAARLSRVPLSWYTRRSTGELTKLVGEDVSAVHPAIAHSPGEIASAVVVPLVSLAYLLTVDWRLTLITLIPVGLALALVPLFMLPARQREQADYDTATGRLGHSAVEFVQGISVVKVFGGADRAHRAFLEAAQEFTDVFHRMVRGLSRIGAGMQLAVSPPFVLLTVLIGGTVRVSAGDLPPADLLPFLLLGLGLTAPVAAMAGHGFDDLLAAGRAIKRIRDVLDVPPLPEPEQPAVPDGHRVELRGVRFGYDADHEVLRGIDLALEPGTVTAVVGPSGSGKSTLAKLLLRFFDPTHGSVTLGRVDLRQLDGRELYRRVSFVFAEVQLLRASVADNIALAVPTAGRDDVERAARTAGLHDRILALPRGYDTVLGEEAELSGGEAQRLTIARALLSEAPIVVLDEATSFADPQTARALRRAWAELKGERTLLIIAHRLETIADADHVVMLDGGVVVEQGRPSDLLAADGRFARFWRAHRNAVAGEPGTYRTASQGDEP